MSTHPLQSPNAADASERASAAAPGTEEVRSGAKYRTAQGFSAIKDGIKAAAGLETGQLFGKPRWLKAPPASGEHYQFVRHTVHQHRLATVCEEAKCPNIG